MSSGHKGVRWLLEELEDPFAIFPLQSAAQLLNDLRSDTEGQLALRQGGIARRYWDVESEHLHEMCGHLLGATFVLGQTALTQTFSILSRLRLAGTSLPSIPNSRNAILEMDAPIDPDSLPSKLVIVDTAANYFKHYHEWPPDWPDSSKQGVAQKSAQSKTIQLALQAGMRFDDVTDNLNHALQLTRIDGPDANGLGSLIQDWRRKLARRLYKALDLEDPENI